ncbi:MAG: mannose-6-phosphate isomerase, class I [Treponema sp.]|jgi:mannose-6-phosphate isomerase|nr:mannose-6-phosphate isomerase, class I [Treponema sp.]
MKRLYKLENQVKHYGWGSPEWIPRLLGRENSSNDPWAELWMGVHPEGPSKIDVDGIGLDELIRQDPSRYLGEETRREFGSLPFLYKLLAAGKPLSIQAHPNKEQARTGWERENVAGLPPHAANRNYRDPNHKPEILCALSPFKAMCGFREVREIQKILDSFSFGMEPGAQSGLEAGAAGNLRALFTALVKALESGPALEVLIRTLFNLSREARRALGIYARQGRDFLTQTYPEYGAEWQTTAYFASLYPEDPGIIAPLYLNLLNLVPGEAIFLPAGVLHAYIEGFGVELMANSDNVLRGGLTEKHIDVDELVRILRFTPFMPAVMSAPREAGVFTYPSECREFSLSVIKGRGVQILTGSSPRIFLVTEGSAILSAGGGREKLSLSQGESAFAAPVEGSEEFSLSGDYTLYAAGIGHA